MSDSANVRIREALVGDLGGVGDLWEELINLHHGLDSRFWVRAPDGRDRFLDWMREVTSSEDRVLLVAVDSRHVLGFVHGMLKNSPPPMADRLSGFITDMIVARPHRRCGIGRALFEAAQDWFRGRRAQEIKLTAALCNQDAVLFWKEMGLEPWTCSMWKDLP